MHDEAALSSEDLANAHVVFEDFDRIEVREGSLWWRGARYPLNAELKIGNFSAWHVTESHFAVYGRVPQCLGDPIEGAPSSIGYSFHDLKVLCKAAAKAADELLEVYYDAARVEDGEKWVPLSRLSYGQRRALVLLAALELGDYVLIENLEAGLHIDLVDYIMNAVAVSRGRVIAETHSGLVLKLAMRHGIPAYYVEKDTSLIRDLSIDLFRREAEVYSSLL